MLASCKSIISYCVIPLWFLARNTIDNVNKLKRKSAEEPKEMKPKELKPKEARKMTDKVDNKPFATEEYSGIRIM